MAPCTLSALLLRHHPCPAVVLPSILLLLSASLRSSPSPACRPVSWGCSVFLSLLLRPGPVYLAASAPREPSASAPVPNTPAAAGLAPFLSRADACSLCTSCIPAEPWSQPALAGPPQCYVTGLRQPSPVASRALGEGRASQAPCISHGQSSPWRWPRAALSHPVLVSAAWAGG